MNKQNECEKKFEIKFTLFGFSVNNNKLSSNLLINIYLDNNIYI